MTLDVNNIVEDFFLIHFQFTHCYYPKLKDKQKLAARCELPDTALWNLEHAKVLGYTGKYCHQEDKYFHDLLMALVLLLSSYLSEYEILMTILPD